MVARTLFKGREAEYNEEFMKWIYSDDKSIVPELKAEIDEEMIPLIKELNKIGLRTTQCCSGHGKQDAYVSIAMDNITYITISKDSERRITIRWKR